ncbi:aspartate/tyrosine/aromatic aminotransferase [Sphingomonas cavernae]|uniref:Aspartate/tyrosine/aromatic aminotransferase n=2 Tax=Sphingomonas cavernae TaxID=2320861 RepID=A0A418W6W7_9SPHN|nr:aspartate/tyrosine/aromatic aminotransferase [Sphingomonas cavernae]
MFDQLKPQPADALLSLIKLYNADPRDSKIDLGVGVYRDETGGTPVFAAVKSAERRLIETQDSKAYLGPEGDVGFVAAVCDLALDGAVADDRVAGLQTPGGTGALRLAIELVVRNLPEATFWVGTPTWPVHMSILTGLGARVRTYEHFDVQRQAFNADAMLAAAREAGRGDIFLLHGCCHNPTGADLAPEHWREVAQILSANGAVPLIDLAYHGLGEGLGADAAGARHMIGALPEALIAYSCDKNFGVYRERTGAVFAIAADCAAAEVAGSNLATIARNNWSMPPDHGAAVARLILTDAELRVQWQDELQGMQARLSRIRQRLAACGKAGDVDLSHIAAQRGMFATLPLSPAAIAALRERHGVYMAGSGRINIAGLAERDCDRFAAALADVEGL